MTANNLRQADVPVGARTIEQMPGTAPGLVCPVGDKVIYAVPGVPREMREMMEGTILPDLRARAGDTGVIRSRVLRSWGISESGLAEMLNEHMEHLDENGRATLAFQASGIEGIKIRIVCKRDTEAETIAALDAEEAIVRPIIGDAIFGVDDETMEIAVIKQLRERSMTMATVETLTGGVLSSRLTAADPDMKVFQGGIVMPPDYIPPGGEAGASESLAIAFARLARERCNTDVGISAVMPAPQEGLAPGSIAMGVAIKDQEVANSVIWYPDRERMRNYAVISVLDVLRKALAAG
jgi:nicotinamide-nucleotide amidase